MSYVVKPTANRKYVRELLARLPKGYRIGMVEEASDGSRPGRLVNRTHPCVLAPDGSLLRDAAGRPVAVCNTPGSQGSLARDLRRIDAAARASRAVA